MPNDILFHVTKKLTIKSLFVSEICLTIKKIKIRLELNKLIKYNLKSTKSVKNVTSATENRLNSNFLSIHT